MSSVKRATICSLCVALCYVLPVAFHAVGLGAAMCPMHLPVLLCGLVCGWPYGAFCGAAGPVISLLFSHMPTPAQLIHMVPEMMIYGLVAGLLMKLIRTGRTTGDVYLSLIPAMLLGRVAGGIAQAAFYLSHARGYSLALWASGYLVWNLPGTVIQLIALPILVSVLSRVGVIPHRYPGGGAPA